MSDDNATEEKENEKLPDDFTKHIEEVIEHFFKQHPEKQKH